MKRIVLHFGSALLNCEQYFMQQKMLGQIPKKILYAEAKKIAAQQAFYKAIPIEISNKISLKDFKIHHDQGRPFFFFVPEIQEKLRNAGVQCIHLSLSKEFYYVFAFVIIELLAN